MEQFTITQKISAQRIYNLIVSAFEGGSNYWYMIQERVEVPKGTAHTFEDKLWTRERGNDASYLHMCELPLNEGGALMIDDERADDPMLKAPVRFDLECIRKGLEAWALDAVKPDEDKTRTAHPSHWGAFIAENDDAETADVFLQYCIFGKVIYG